VCVVVALPDAGVPVRESQTQGGAPTRIVLTTKFGHDHQLVDDVIG
jgi:hypothetical protein